MKTWITWFCFALITASLFSVVAAEPEAVAGKAGKLVHMVSFKFKAEATPAQIKSVEEAFRALEGKISQIKSFRWGTNNSPEKLNKGFTHGFVLTFKNEKDRNAYLEHPAHKEFGKLVTAILDDVFVLDFQNRK